MKWRLTESGEIELFNPDEAAILRFDNLIVLDEFIDRAVDMRNEIAEHMEQGEGTIGE